MSDRTEAKAAQLDPRNTALARDISFKMPRSPKWIPLKPNGRHVIEGEGVADYENDRYAVSVRRYSTGFPIGGGEYVHIGISAIDGSALHDWRDFQRIKNEVCGREWEAVELYPAESRLVDPSNYYMLWCVPPGVLGVGIFDSRVICDDRSCIAPQRRWAIGDEPPELKRVPS